MSVQEYLDKHMLSRKIEDAVNAAVRAKTPDPVLFIVSIIIQLQIYLYVLLRNFVWLVFDAYIGVDDVFTCKFTV